MVIFLISYPPAYVTVIYIKTNLLSGLSFIYQNKPTVQAQPVFPLFLLAGL